HQPLELLDVADLLAGGDADRTDRRQLAVALDVVGVQRLLEPRRPELLELPRPSDRRRRVVAEARVDHQLGRLTDAGAGGTDVGDVALLALAQRPPAELDGPVTLLRQLPADALRLG